MMAYGTRKELMNILRQIEAQGWTVSNTRNGHFKLKPPDGGQIIHCAGSPGDARGLKNLKAQLRRAGATLK